MASEISSSVYATRRKELLALVNQLRAVGAQSELDLPRIAVIGNQSAGKSSVVEAISGIKVPRDAGTCTRCPMECRLSSSSSPWSCRILIRREFDKFGKPLDEVSETLFGNTITDKADVEPMLRRAQVSVLNPDITVAKILSSTLDELKEWSDRSQEMVPFSRNVIIVDLEGPELTDLAFIDLPGLIQNAEANTVQLVEDMVSSHIKGNCLILVALPMTDDIENQKALRLARIEDPEGRRTIGVLTKPDMLGAGSTKALGLWLDVIEGRSRHQLTHGYYCTRQPDDAERSDPSTAARARENEIAFFKNTLPWAKSNHTHRFGRDNLITNLSRLLVKIIDDTLPAIRSEAMLQFEDTCYELARIPHKVEEEPATYMLNLLTGFAGEFQQYVKGSAETAKLIQQHRDAYKVLKIAIRRTAPNFMPCLPKETRVPFTNSLEEDENDRDGLMMSNEKKALYLTEMRLYIDGSITRELPNNVPFDAKVALIMEFQATWAVAVAECFNAVEKATLTLLMKKVDIDFQRYEILRGHIRTFLHELVTKHRENCQRFLDTALEAELTPYTQNSHYLEDSTEKWLSKYKSIRAGESTANDNNTFFKSNDATSASATAASSNQTLSPIFSFGGKRPSSELESGSSNSNQAQPTAQPAANANTNGMFPSTQPKSTPAQIATPTGTPATSEKSVPFWERATPLTTPSTSGTPALGPFSNDTNFTKARSQSQEATEDLNHALALLAKHGYTGLTTENLGRLHPPDEYERELKTMAEVRGYFQVAYKRIIDNIPSFIDLRFVKALSREIQPFLITKFGLGTASASDRCKKYLEEDPTLVAKRDELVARKKRLESVQQELMGFGHGLGQEGKGVEE
ncbi:hypothetical protein K435DRAFT_753802 [Dendrothele bispora CBS 962.96]|uniref:P-loop containing nucleoside triphosphate hydrolase protein n=1 Tax=Dendrothele bispora (strain CBS 962.96) TaxID=1314807 RepID=A0A4S8M5V4_DENBC|nr:hypothetical protein K435DRAFT_753802 [Dendrothele bispora CBS 962.96]